MMLNSRCSAANQVWWGDAPLVNGEMALETTLKPPPTGVGKVARARR